MVKNREMFEKQIETEADLIIKNNLTVRKAAVILKLSKTGVHFHMTKKLPNIDYDRYLKVKKVFDKNKAERHIRGGMATKMKYEKLEK